MSEDQMILGNRPASGNSERRSVRRFNMKLPVAVRVSGIPSEFATQTENVSARGVFFFLDRWMKEGAYVDVIMTLPPQVTLTEPVRVRFQARVIRVKPETFSTRVGIAALIEEYEFLRSREPERAMETALKYSN